MANLPAPQNKSSTPELSRHKEAAASLLAKGYRPAEIAKMKYPDDPKKRRSLRLKLWRMVRSDAQVQQRIAEIARGELVMGVAPASKRLAKRATRLGKSPDVKLLYEASGFHNPRVQHEHSGDITVTLDIPRPAKVPNLDEQVVDAEIVED
jgi:hypothetical protein